jgi:transcriptional regulator with XRE-family HTH domain
MHRYTAEEVRLLRKNLKITQERAARLLGISNNTWIRWERGEFECDQEAVDLLRNLAQNLCPEPCYDSRSAKKIDWPDFARHLRACNECKRMIQYFAMLAKQ